MTRTTTSKHALKQLRKLVRDQRAAYALARWVALMAGRQHRARRTGKTRWVREDALHDALGCRGWLKHYTERLAAEERKQVVAHGGRWSPAALERNGLDKTGA